jgi:hypothetical protein
MATSIAQYFKVFGGLLQKAGPYLVLEILLPGGTLFALLLFLYQRREQPATADAPPESGVVERTMREIAFVAQPDGIASVWRGRHRERDGLEALAIAPAM